MAYTYDQTRIVDRGVDRMRLELGDTEVQGGADTCVLSDEEYQALIDSTYGAGASWKQARLCCLRAIVARLAMMADATIDGLSVDMSSRYERWRVILDSHERMIEGICAPRADMCASAMSRGMHDNPRALGGARC